MADYTYEEIVSKIEDLRREQKSLDAKFVYWCGKRDKLKEAEFLEKMDPDNPDLDLLLQYDSGSEKASRVVREKVTKGTHVTIGGVWTDTLQYAVSIDDVDDKTIALLKKLLPHMTMRPGKGCKQISVGLSDYNAGVHHLDYYPDQDKLELVNTRYGCETVVRRVVGDCWSKLEEAWKSYKQEWYASIEEDEDYD